MSEPFNGAASAPDFKTLDMIEEGLFQAVNNACARLPRSEIEYTKALRALNDFALRKPIRGSKKLMGLD